MSQSALDRRQFLGTLGAAPLAAAASADRPNIILIVTDDQRYDAFSASGCQGIFDFLKTPNMDRLAREGMNFRRAYSTTSLCSPSRASILTGQYAHTHGVNSLEESPKPDARIFPEYLRRAGYDTGFVGKWHLGKESEKPVTAYNYWAAFRAQGRYFNPVMNVNGATTKTEGYVTDLLTDYALDFIGKKRDRPFFLHLSHKAPHAQCEAPKHLEKMFEGVSIPYPPSYSEKHDDKPAWFLECHNHDAFHIHLHPKAAYERYMKDYARTLVSVDENLGRLLDTLDRSGAAKNTVVVYTSDNGHLMAEHQLYSKMIMYEEAIRLPLLVRYPGRTSAGSVCDEFALNVDLAPTILDLAGVPAPESVEGKSFRPLIEGKKLANWRKSFLYEYDDGWGLPPLEGVRTSDGWQYARYPDWEQMYYMPEDPHQIRNLAKNPKFAEKKRQLILELERLGGWRKFTRGPSAYTRQSEPKHTPHPPDFDKQ